MRSPRHDDEPDADVVELLDRQGFAAEAVGDRRGIVDGALEEAGSGDSVDRLDAFVEPALCVAHLRR